MFPKIISIGSFFIPAYGLLVALGFLAGIWVTTALAKRTDLKPDPVANLALYSAIAGLVGAKLFMFLFDFRYYREHPGELFSLSTLQAAGVFQGGLLLALLTAFWYMRRESLPPLATADVFAPGVALGHGIGRLGCFAAGCCWGKETHLPWAVTFRNPEANRLVGVPLGQPLHPTQLYEAFAEFLIFWYLYRRGHRPHEPGTIIGLYLTLYSTVRFLVEFLRNHEQGLILGLSLTQWISLGFLIAGVSLLRRPRRLQTA